MKMRVSCAAAAISAVVHAPGQRSVERRRHEVTTIVGEEAGEVDRAERGRRFESIPLALHRARRTEHSTCRTRSAAELVPRFSVPRAASSQWSRRHTAPVLSENVVVVHGLIERDVAHAALELEASRTIERIRDDAGDAALGLPEDDELIGLRRVAVRKPADGALEAATEIRHLSADEAPVPAVRLIHVGRPAHRVLHAEAAPMPVLT